jgi:hypothetical protein
VPDQSDDSTIRSQGNSVDPEWRHSVNQAGPIGPAPRSSEPDQADDSRVRSRGSSVDPEWRHSLTQDAAGGIAAWQGSITNTISGWQFGSSAYSNRDQYVKDANSYREQYVEDAKRGVAVARRKYYLLFRLYWALRALAIVAGISVAALAATPAPRWVLGLLGALAAAAETVIAAGNLQERAVVSGLLADRMARELRDYSLRFDSYAEGDPLETLHSRIEKLRDEASTARFRLDRSTDKQNSQSVLANEASVSRS